MRPLLAAAFCSMNVLAVAAANSQGSADHVRYDARSADIGKGRAVAVGANLSPAVACFRCHGVDGKGDPAAAFPRLSQQAYSYLYDSLKDYASGSRKNAVMTPIAKVLTDAQMRDVSAYYAAQAGLDEGPQPASSQFVDPKLLQYGAALAAVGNAKREVQGCINCHGPEGRGLAPTYPYLAGQYANYLEAQLKAWQSGKRGPDRATNGVMQHVAKQLSDEDTRAVALYYASIRFRSGRPAVSEPATQPTPAPARISPGR